MARYIDIDLLFDKVEETTWYHINKNGELVVGANSETDIPLYKHSDIMRVLAEATEADVVPKSEYDAVVSAVDNSTKEFLKLHDDYQEEKRKVELLKRQLEPFKEKQCFTCKHYDIGHDHVPCCYCEDYNKYIWLSADADTDIHASNEDETSRLKQAKIDVAREIFDDIERLIELHTENTPVHIPFNYIDIKFVHWVAELKKEYMGDKR